MISLSEYQTQPTPAHVETREEDFNGLEWRCARVEEAVGKKSHWEKTDSIRNFVLPVKLTNGSSTPLIGIGVITVAAAASKVGEGITTAIAGIPVSSALDITLGGPDGGSFTTAIARYYKC